MITFKFDICFYIFMESLDDNEEEKFQKNKSLKDFYNTCNLGKLGRFQDAIEWYDKALESDLKHINSLNKKGEALASLGKFDEAEKLFERAWEIQQNNTCMCQLCGNANLSHSEYCNKCGHMFATLCSICGKINPYRSSFCNACGFILT